MKDEQSIKEALAAFGEKAKKLAELTLKDADQFIADIESGLQSGDSSAVGLAAHSIKSIVKQIGALELGDLCFQMETSGKSGDLEKCRALWPALKAGYDEVKIFVESL